MTTTALLILRCLGKVRAHGSTRPTPGLKSLTPIEITDRRARGQVNEIVSITLFKS